MPFPQQQPMSSLLPAWVSMVAASEGALGELPVASVSPGSAMALESTDRSRRWGCGVSLGGMTDSSESVVLVHGTPQIQGCADMRCSPSQAIVLHSHWGVRLAVLRALLTLQRWRRNVGRGSLGQLRGQV